MISQGWSQASLGGSIPPTGGNTGSHGQCAAPPPAAAAPAAPAAAPPGVLQAALVLSTKVQPPTLLGGSGKGFMIFDA